MGSFAYLLLLFDYYKRYRHSKEKIGNNMGGPQKWGLSARLVHTNTWTTDKAMQRVG